MHLSAIFVYGILNILQDVGSQALPDCPNLSTPPAGYTSVTYNPSNDFLENPHRGWAQLVTTRASNFVPLTVSGLDNYRASDGITLFWRQYVLDQFVSSPVTQAFLDLIRADLQVIRDARFTTVLRFYYVDRLPDPPVAPYGDATREWMLIHADQLSAIFSEFHDIIDVVQTGFIGTWGEWYYTTDFGDPNELDWSNPDNIRGLTPQNWQDRTDVLMGVVNAVTPPTQVQMRVPTYKQVPVNDWSPTTEQEFTQNTTKSRVGHHNDCFLADATDSGTYVNKSVEYPYLQQDTLYCAMGGETCRVSTTDRHECPTATKELSELHYSYLNQAYNQDVYNVWKQQGCYPVIHRQLGYRIQLEKATFPLSGSRGDQLCMELELTNVGYAPPMKDKTVGIVIRNTATSGLFMAQFSDVDIRLWLPGNNIKLTKSVFVPSSVPEGSYQVLLVLQDKLLPSQSDYSILLANSNVPEHTIGLNNLGHTIQIQGLAQGSPGSLPVLQAMTQPQESPYSRLYCYPGESCSGSSSCFDYPLVNPSFETTGEGWQSHGQGFSYTTSTASHGVQSIEVIDGGAYQVIAPPTGTRYLTITADSWNEFVPGTDTNDYSIYCDIKLSDDSWMYGQVARFAVGETNWHTRTLQVSTNQDIAEGWCYAMFRNSPAGVAYIDHFRVKYATDATQCQ